MTSNFATFVSTTILIVFFSLNIFQSSNIHNNTLTFSKTEPNPFIQEQISQDSLPSKSKSRQIIRVNKNGKKVYVKIINGDIKKLKINGKTIPKKDHDLYSELVAEIMDSKNLPTPPTPPTPPTLDFSNTTEEDQDILSTHDDDHKELDKSASKDHSTSEVFTAQLLKDNLISDSENFNFRLTRKKFKVDGKIQSEEIREKYIRLYEKLMGKKMNNRTSYEVTHNSN